jgi:hypothetical protein
MHPQVNAEVIRLAVGVKHPVIRTGEDRVVHEGKARLRREAIGHVSKLESAWLPEGSPVSDEHRKVPDSEWKSANPMTRVPRAERTPVDAAWSKSIAMRTREVLSALRRDGIRVSGSVLHVVPLQI